MTKSKSQIGGESSFRGFDYQKKFIAFLCIKMLKQASSIKSITCEHNDDIEVREDSKLKYYQVKSTLDNKLPNTRIIDAIKLISSNEPIEDKANYNEYVIVSNANIAGITELGVEYSINNIDEKLLQTIRSLEEIKSKEHILERVYVLKGPALEEMEDIIFAHLYKALQNPNQEYRYESVKDELLHYINDMCPGPTNLEDITIIRESEKEQYDLNHKTITLDILNKIIAKHQVSSTNQRLIHFEKSFTFKYDILPPHANEEHIKKIHNFINEYNIFSQDNDLKFAYLKIFNEISGKFDIYKDKVFLDFLKSELENSNNKHIILECSFILHKLIRYSQSDEEASFIEYINKEYFPLFKKWLESIEEKYEYSAFKLEQIIEELKDIISNEQLCELYWNRLVAIIVKIHNTGITDNTLWNCIRHLNKCKIKDEWRKWLIDKNELSDIKNIVFSELSSSMI